MSRRTMRPHWIGLTIGSLAAAIAAAPFVHAAAGDPKESDYYPITTFSTPQETAMEVGSIEVLPNNKLALLQPHLLSLRLRTMYSGSCLIDPVAARKRFASPRTPFISRTATRRLRGCSSTG